jgi:hypothetical protein
VALAASAVGAAVALVGATTGAGTTALLPCTSSQLTLAEVITPRTAGLNAAALFSFTNTSRRTCTLLGYPTFSAREPKGRMALHRVEHGGTYASVAKRRIHQKEPIPLRHGDDAVFGVTWVPYQPSQYCLDPPTLYVTSVPPGNTQALLTRIHITDDLCGPLVVGSVAPSYALPA